MILYTFGYIGQSRNRLLEVLQERNLLLVDIRFQPRSRNPIWNLTNLSRALGNIYDGSARYNPPRYLPISQWGNLNYNRQDQPIQIADFDWGMQEFQKHGYSRWDVYAGIVLMCACRDVEMCHRTVLAERLRAGGYHIDGELTL